MQCGELVKVPILMKPNKVNRNGWMLSEEACDKLIDQISDMISRDEMYVFLDYDKMTSLSISDAPSLTSSVGKVVELVDDMATIEFVKSEIVSREFLEEQCVLGLLLSTGDDVTKEKGEAIHSVNYLSFGFLLKQNSVWYDGE
jgi:hypothetical protein